ncbi:MAG: hypothetical protein K0R38_3586 [Polyangiaceae bacterium]|nr:hypothetical protein [Polyangiaceae bacterium]
MRGLLLSSCATSPVMVSALGGSSAEFWANCNRWLTNVWVVCPPWSLSCVLVASICAHPVTGGAAALCAAAGASNSARAMVTLGATQAPAAGDSVRHETRG